MTVRREGGGTAPGGGPRRGRCPAGPTVLPGRRSWPPGGGRHGRGAGHGRPKRPRRTVRPDGRPPGAADGEHVGPPARAPPDGRRRLAVGPGGGRRPAGGRRRHAGWPCSRITTPLARPVPRRPPRPRWSCPAPRRRCPWPAKGQGAVVVPAIALRRRSRAPSRRCPSPR